MSDVIIVLARGIEGDGTLAPDTISRVQKGIELYKEGLAPKIVMSGSSSFHLDIDPKFTEAAAMKRLAIEGGVQPDDVIEEKDSKDTLGNAYFTKKRICEPNNWHNVTVVASEDHIERARYLFNKLYGPNYQLQFITSSRVIDDKKYQSEQRHEAESLALAKKWLDQIQDGDDAAVWRLMTTMHPAYKTT